MGEEIGKCSGFRYDGSPKEAEVDAKIRKFWSPRHSFPLNDEECHTFIFQIDILRP